MNDTGWEELYDLASKEVFHLALRLTGDADLAADITHDTFIRVWERQDQYLGRGSRVGWICTIARNIARDHLRRRKLRSFADPTDDGSIARAETPPDSELGLVIEDAVATLSDRHRQVFLLHTVDGYSHPEIADMLGIPVGTSKARLSRARVHLRTLIDPTSATSER